MLNEFELKNLISKGAKEQIYFLFGDDPYLVKTYADKIVKEVVGDNEDLDLTVFDYNVLPAEINDALSQFSFLGGRKCVTVSNLNFDELLAAEYKDLKSVIETAPDNNCLVLYFDSFVVDKKRSKRFKELEKLIDSVGGVIAELNHRTEMQLIKLLTEGAKKRGLILTNDTARFLINYVSSDLNILINELNKLCLYKVEGEITANDVERLCARSLEGSIYNISNQILSKNIDQAISEINVLISQKIEPYYIYSEISSCFTDIYNALAVNEAGASFDMAADKLGYPKHISFRLKNALRYARSLGDKKVSKILKILISADSEIKASTDAGSLEKLIFSLLTVL